MVISQSLPHRFLLYILVVFEQESLVLQRLHPLLVSERVAISIWSGISPAAPDVGDLGGVLGIVPPVVAPDLSCMLFIHLQLRVNKNICKQ